MLLVVSPGLPFELAGGQVLLVRAGLVVEGVEEGLRLQLLKQQGAVQVSGAGVWVGARKAVGQQARLEGLGAPQPVGGGGQATPAWNRFGSQTIFYALRGL